MKYIKENEHITVLLVSEEEAKEKGITDTDIPEEIRDEVTEHVGHPFDFLICDRVEDWMRMLLLQEGLVSPAYAESIRYIIFIQKRSKEEMALRHLLAWFNVHVTAA